VDLDAVLGENDSGGPAGNLDDLRTAYSADTIHMNATGYAAVGAAVAAGVQAELV
jgi:lysophospholipase L1-like esterase